MMLSCINSIHVLSLTDITLFVGEQSCPFFKRMPCAWIKSGYFYCLSPNAIIYLTPVLLLAVCSLTGDCSLPSILGMLHKNQLCSVSLQNVHTFTDTSPILIPPITPGFSHDVVQQKMERVVCLCVGKSKRIVPQFSNFFCLAKRENFIVKFM